jgi:hypothetical protein
MAEQVEAIKWVPNTNFLVDGFRFQSPRCSSYFLTHYHGDHTCGAAYVRRAAAACRHTARRGCAFAPGKPRLSSTGHGRGAGLARSFGAGHLEAVIYCSPITAKLLVHDFGLPAKRVRALPLDEAVVVDGVRVTLIDANHVRWPRPPCTACLQTRRRECQGLSAGRAGSALAPSCSCSTSATVPARSPQRCASCGVSWRLPARSMSWRAGVAARLRQRPAPAGSAGDAAHRRHALAAEHGRAPGPARPAHRPALHGHHVRLAQARAPAPGAPLP